MINLESLTEKDCHKYLESGSLTEPFIDIEFVILKIQKDKETYPDASTIESLMRWINYKVPFTQDVELKNKHKFKRTAKEIWEDGFCTGCTDRAMIFATLARQLNIPTTLLHTAELSWVQKCKNGEKPKIHSGHSFCECFFEGKWILVDPTFGKIEFDYDCNKIHLSYQVSNSNDFISYFRGLDLGKRQTMKEHNEEMDEICKEINL